MQRSAHVDTRIEAKDIVTKYEITYLTVHEEGANAETVNETLGKHGVSIVSVQNWGGRRKLAYPIKKEEFAFYTTVVFESETSSIQPINNELNTNEAVLRFLIVNYVAQPERSQMPEVTAKTEEVKAAAPVVAEPVTEEVKAEVTEEKEEKTEEEAKPKRARAKKDKSEDEVKALDDTLDKLLSEDITQ